MYGISSTTFASSYCGCGVGVGAEEVTAADAATRIFAMTVPIGTTSFSLNKSCSIIPSAVEGTSLSTL